MIHLRTDDKVVLALSNELVRAHRAGIDIGDVLAAACREAARRIGGDLTSHRSGSWEAEHVEALSRGWDWDVPRPTRAEKIEATLHADATGQQ